MATEVKILQFIDGVNVSTPSETTQTIWAHTDPTGTYTAGSETVLLADSSGGLFTISLPAAASSLGKFYQIKKISTDTNVITIDPNGAETIDGQSTAFLKFKDQSMLIYCDGVKWDSIQRKDFPNYNFVSVSSSPYSQLNEDVTLVDTTSGNVTVNLVSSSGSKNKVIRIKKISTDSNSVTINPNAAETIDGQTTYTITEPYQTVEILCDGTNWHII